MSVKAPVTRIKRGLRKEDVFRALLDTDVVMIGTDPHSSRATVNDSRARSSSP